MALVDLLLHAVDSRMCLLHPRIVLCRFHFFFRHDGGAVGHEAQRRQTLYACWGTRPENALEHMAATQENKATQTIKKTIANKTILSKNEM